MPEAKPDYLHDPELDRLVAELNRADEDSDALGHSATILLSVTR